MDLVSVVCPNLMVAAKVPEETTFDKYPGGSQPRGCSKRDACVLHSFLHLFLTLRLFFSGRSLTFGPFLLTL